MGFTFDKMKRDPNVFDYLHHHPRPCAITSDPQNDVHFITYTIKIYCAFDFFGYMWTDSSRKVSHERVNRTGHAEIVAHFPDTKRGDVR